MSVWFRIYSHPINIQCDPQSFSLVEDVVDLRLEVWDENRITVVKRSRLDVGRRTPVTPEKKGQFPDEPVRKVWCLLWINKTRVTEKTYIWVSVWWKTQNQKGEIYTPLRHWVGRGTGTPKDNIQIGDRPDSDGWLNVRIKDTQFYLFIMNQQNES